VSGVDCPTAVARALGGELSAEGAAEYSVTRVDCPTAVPGTLAGTLCVEGAANDSVSGVDCPTAVAGALAGELSAEGAAEYSVTGVDGSIVRAELGGAPSIYRKDIRMIMMSTSAIIISFRQRIVRCSDFFAE
jgi:hypothetical protein